MTLAINDTANSGTALFRFTDDATIKNLTLEGSVVGTIHAAALIGHTIGGNTIVENVILNVAVTNPLTSGSRHIGGVVGHGRSASLTLKNIVFSGTMSNSVNYAGGLLGWSDGSTLNLENCLFSGTYSGNGKFHPVAISNNVAKMSLTVNACCYTAAPNFNDAHIVADIHANIPAQVHILTLPENIIATDTILTIGNKTCVPADSTVTLAGKTGYVFENISVNGESLTGKTLTVTGDATVNGTVIFDTTNHYVFVDGNTYTLATADNAANHDLIQVCALALPKIVTPRGDGLITLNGKLYATANTEITLEYPVGYSLDGVIFSGATLSGNTLTIGTEDVTFSGELNDAWGICDGADGSAEKPFLIGNVAGLRVLAEQCTKYAADKSDYGAGLTFKLTADIDSVDFQINKAKSFAGTFDGNGHTITVNLNAKTNNDGALFIGISNATIKNLTVAGTVTASGKFAAGIAVHSWNKCTIENCRSSVTINSKVNGDGSHGGFIGIVSTELNFIDCTFDGKLLGENTHSCGGFVGWKGGRDVLNLTNCLFAPTEVTIKTDDCATFARRSVTKSEGCRYTQALGAVQGEETSA